MRLIAWNVLRDERLDFDHVRQAIEDSKGMGLKPGHLGVVLIPVDTDPELLAQALNEIANDLREHGTEALYKGAEIPAAA
jgi:hypothetical protein